MYALIGYLKNNNVPKVTLWGLYSSETDITQRIRDLIHFVKPNSRGIYYGNNYTLWIKQIELGDLNDWDLSSNFMVSF
jgi:hypothetical protein